MVANNLFMSQPNSVPPIFNFSIFKNSLSHTDVIKYGFGKISYSFLNLSISDNPVLSPKYSNAFT